MDAVDRFIVRLNNLATKIRKGKYRPDEVLLLFPHCMQHPECGQNILQDLKNCKRCGKCKIGEMLKVAKRFGVRAFVASGGRLALAEVKKPEIKAIVAVACEKELKVGVLGAIPKKVYAVPNSRPHGPCKFTNVEVDAVCEKLIEFIGAPPEEPGKAQRQPEA